jgi:transcriptional regulator with XRE-family HTH domain
LNEPLRQALVRAGLREDDVAAQLGVDPKTVRRWLSGRVPYPSSRAALANLVGADEVDLWPNAGGPLTSRTRPDELAAVYPHRWVIPRDVWKRLFESAEHEISILAYSALFLAEDAGMLAIIADKARSGVRVRLALGDPDSAAVAQRGQEEGIGNAMPAKVRNALTLYRAALKVENVEIRLHNTVLYNSIYRADKQLFVNQHAFGLPAAHAPVLCYRPSENVDMVTAYLDSFERVWAITNNCQLLIWRTSSTNGFSALTSPTITNHFKLRIHGPGFHKDNDFFIGTCSHKRLTESRIRRRSPEKRLLGR